MVSFKFPIVHHHGHGQPQMPLIANIHNCKWSVRKEDFMIFFMMRTELFLVFALCFCVFQIRLAPSLTKKLLRSASRQDRVEVRERAGERCAERETRTRYARDPPGLAHRAICMSLDRASDRERAIERARQRETPAAKRGLRYVLATYGPYGKKDRERERRADLRYALRNGLARKKDRARERRVQQRASEETLVCDFFKSIIRRL